MADEDYAPYDASTPLHGEERGNFVAIVGALLGVAAIIGVFALITWAMYASR